MKKSISIGLCVLCVLGAAACLPSCKTSNLPPMDDAYYWEEHAVVETVKTAEAVEKAAPAEPVKSVEFVNVQDTTVTIKIRR